MHSVELTLDDPADAAVRADWARLLRARLPSQGRHTGVSNRPHITLALTESVTQAVRDRLAAIAADLPVPLAVGALLVFGRRQYILSRQVVPNTAILGLQRRVVDALDEAVDRRGTFGAGAWTPHITLGRRFSAEQLASAMSALGSVRPVDGAGASLRLWDIGTHREDRLG
ncbi:MAG TPA: 2'-5' RNA ligase family protein [Nakamurella sp.]